MAFAADLLQQRRTLVECLPLETDAALVVRFGKESACADANGFACYRAADPAAGRRVA